MSVFSSVMASIGYEPKRDINDLRIWGDGGTYSSSGVTVTADNAFGLDITQGCLEALASPVASLPIMVFKRNGEDCEPALDHPLYDLLHDSPNGRQTSTEFRDELIRHLSFWRNFYAQIVPDGDNPIGSLEIIHPKRMKEVKRTDDGRVTYRFSSLEVAKPDIVLRDDQIWHIRKPPLTDNGLQGRPIFETSYEVFGRAIAVKQYGSRFFKNSGRSGGVLKHPGNFKSKDDERDFLESWRSSGTGENAHKDRLLKYGVDYVPIDVQNDQAQFIQTMQEENNAVCRLWNMPPHRAGILDKATFSNIEQQSIEFVVYTLAPWIEAIEQAAERDLLVGDDQDQYFVEFNVAGLLRGDLAARYAAFAAARQWGWLSVNEIRKMDNLNSVKNGDEYLRPLNMVPAGSPAAAPTEPTGGNNAPVK
jgi:HK97 family phage portal protein